MNKTTAMIADKKRCLMCIVFDIVKDKIYNSLQKYNDILCSAVKARFFIFIFLEFGLEPSKLHIFFGNSLP